jgi:aspartate kinase
MFDLLGEADINIQMITTSEIKISVIVDEALVDHGANLVHAGFGLDWMRP